MMDVIISREPENLQIDAEIEEIVRHAAEVTGPLYGVENGEVSITLTNNEYIHELNNQYRGLDRPTDVLSFAFADSMEEEPEISGGSETEMLGDIIISVEKAQEQAKEYGHSLKRELSFLTVHGMLHLMGYDHMDEEERLEMEEEQRYVMHKLGISRDDGEEDMKLPLAQAPDVVKDKAAYIDVNSLAAPPKKDLPKGYKSGFVAVIGRPNVGKSTLINSLIGQKIAIMSDKPQTTRNRIMCVLTKPDVQMVFLDTPGIHKPIDKLGEYMVKAAEGTLQEVDAIIFVVDANEKFGPGEHYILERLKATKKPVVLAINKVDLLADKDALLPIITNYNEKYNFAGKPQWNTINCDFYDFIRNGADGQQELSAGDILYNWSCMIYNPLTGQMGYKTQYATSATLAQLDPAGNIIRAWNMFGIFPKNINFGDGLDYSSGEQCLIHSEFAYDLAIKVQDSRTESESA